LKAGDPTKRQEFNDLAKAYIFGDKILDRDFCDFVIDSILIHAQRVSRWPYLLFFDIFNASTDEAPARHLLTDAFIYVAHEGWLISMNHEEKNFSEEAWKAIAYALVRKKNQTTHHTDGPWLHDPCKYHWHRKNSTSCYRLSKSWSVPKSMPKEESKTFPKSIVKEDGAA
jgi:hypothetical protein